MSRDYSQSVDRATIDKTVDALTANGFDAIVVTDAAEAQKAVQNIIPRGSEVLTNTSATLDTTGITDIIENSGEYNPVRQKFYALSADPSKSKEKRQLGSAPDYAIGSVQAITEDGKILIASATGSQLAGYVFGAEKVVFVVGAQKLVKDLAEAQDRLQKHVFPLEDKRSQKAYGVNSAIRKEFVFHSEMPGRVKVVIIEEAFGF